MKLRKLNIPILFATGLLMMGCADDFLDVPSQERVEAEHSGENYHPETLVNGVYGMFTDWNYGFAFLGISEIISDNANKGSSPTDTGTDKDILDALTYTSTAASFASLWEHWYKSIGRASEAILYAQEYEMEDESYRQRLIAEARFLRALNYFYLVRGWGDIPIQEIDLIDRAPTDQVYDYIETDLNFAIENLPVKSAYAAKDLGRATKGAAQALLAKVHLYQQEWQPAYDLAQAVINSGEYGLEADYATI